MSSTSSMPRLFDPNGVYWRVNREGVLRLGGGCALLLELAHPKVAAAVAQYSSFRDQPLTRLVRTIRAMQRITYGTRDEAFATAAGINRMHERMSGYLPEGTACFAAGAPYRASDPELLRWVWATLVHTSLTTYQVFLAPLSRDEREAYYEESRLLARLFGIPNALVPERYGDFEAYWRAMIRSSTLEITPTSRMLADAILHPPITGFPRWLGDVTGVTTLGLLEPVIRHRYGFPWGARRGRAWRLSRGMLSRALPRVPDLARVSGSARRAERVLIAA